MVLNALDTISGKEGKAYIKRNGNNEELFFCRNIKADVTNKMASINALGVRNTQYKMTGEDHQGSMTIYDCTPIFLEIQQEYQETGVLQYFDIVVINDDPTSRAGNKTVLLKDCFLEGLTLAQLDADTDEMLSSSVNFKFNSWQLTKNHDPITE